MMERELIRKAERVQPAMPGSVEADEYEHQPDDALDYVPDDNPDSLLRDIERLGASAEASTLLDEFLARYPDHPVSVKIRQLGD